MTKLPPLILEIYILLLHRVRKKYLCDRWQLWPWLSQLFLNRFSKFLCLSCSKFPEFFKTPPTFAFWMNFVWENGKKQNEVWLLGHPVVIPSGFYPMFLTCLDHWRWRIFQNSLQLFKIDWSWMKLWKITKNIGTM